MKNVTTFPRQQREQQILNRAKKHIEIIAEDAQEMSPEGIREASIRTYMRTMEDMCTAFPVLPQTDLNCDMLRNLYGEAVDMAGTDVDEITRNYIGQYGTGESSTTFFGRSEQEIKKANHPSEYHGALIGLLVVFLCHTPYIWHTEFNIFLNITRNVYLNHQNR